MANPETNEFRHANDHRDLSIGNDGFFLARLRHFTDYAHSGVAVIIPQQRLARRAVFSAYLDCIELGLALEAEHIINERQSIPIQK